MLLCIAITLLLICCTSFYLRNKRTKYHELDINVPIEYILFCISEEYHIDTLFLEPLIRNKFSKASLKTILAMLSKEPKTQVVNNLASRFSLRKDVAEKVVEYLDHQRNHSIPFSEERMDDFLWRKAKLRDAISSVEDITREYQNTTDAFIYKVDGISYIFSNLSKFMESIKNIPVRLKSDQRCRMSFEIKGQPRTGKTLCSKYVLPYFCAKTINRQRRESGLTDLSRAPVFYLMMEKNGNPIRALYNALKHHLSEIINYHPNQEFTDNYALTLQVQKYMYKYFQVYSDSHMFIILDEIQLIDSKYLDLLRITIKSRDFQKCTFILTGSTMSMFNLTMSKTYRNGLSYFENTIIYDIPFNNTKICIEESLKVLFDRSIVNRRSLTLDETLLIKSYCTNLNVAYISQILRWEQELQLPFTKSIYVLFEEIFKIYERDIDIDSTVIVNILKGDLESLQGTFLVTKINRRLVLTDKLLALFLHKHYVLSENNEVIKKTTYDNCLNMFHVRIFGERISRLQTWKKSNPLTTLPNDFAGIENFFEKSNIDCKITEEAVNRLRDKLKTIASTNFLFLNDLTSPKTKTELLQHFFVSIRHLMCHQVSISSRIDYKCQKVLKIWLDTDKKFSNFILSVMETNTIMLDEEEEDEDE